MFPKEIGTLYGLRLRSHPILGTDQVPLAGCAIVLYFGVILAQEGDVAPQLLWREENVNKGAESKKVAAAKPEKRLSWVTARAASMGAFW